MTENSEDEWMEQWNAFTGAGHFDSIEHPEGGYKIGAAVTDRSGIFCLVKGFKGNGQVIIALDREENGKTKVVNINDIRFNGDVMLSFVKHGFVKLPDRTIGAEPPPGNKSKFN